MVRDDRFQVPGRKYSRRAIARNPIGGGVAIGIGINGDSDTDSDPEKMHAKTFIRIEKGLNGLPETAT